MSSLSDPQQAARRRFDATTVNETALAALAALRNKQATAGTHPDGELLAACATGAVLWQRQHDAFYGATRVVDDDERDRLLAPVWAMADPVLHRICDLRATTLDGHQARAAILLAWDGGAMLGAVEADDKIEVRLVLALAVDILGNVSTPAPKQDASS